MKKLFLLFLTILFASSVSATICCEQGCFPDTQTYNGVDYELKCCTDSADPNKGTAYLGCLGSDGKSYCLNDVFGDCLKCDYIAGSYQWVRIDTLCGPCKHCESSYDAQSRPTASSCVFDAGYSCVADPGGASICLAEAEAYNIYCCKSDKTVDAGKPLCSAFNNFNICYHSGTTTCTSNGWSLCSWQQQDKSLMDWSSCYDYANPKIDTKGTPEKNDDGCYYQDKTFQCTNTGWTCTLSLEDINHDVNCRYKDEATRKYHYNCKEYDCTYAIGWTCGSPTLASTVFNCQDVCDDCDATLGCDAITNSDNDFFTDYDPAQLTNNVYEIGIDERFVDYNYNNIYDAGENVNEGATLGIQTPIGSSFHPIIDTCDTEANVADCADGIDNDADGYCDINGCGTMPLDTGCQNLCGAGAGQYCADCGRGFANFCDEIECEQACYSSTGTFCYFSAGSCCDDKDNDNVCDRNDNCPSRNNPAQADTDNDGIGDDCDACITIRQSESILSSDSLLLCTGTDELTCLTSNKCQMVNVGEDFFCTGAKWLNRNLCIDCFFSDEDEYYWIDEKDKVCYLTGNQLLETDIEQTVCELLEEDIQNSCDEGETGCWDIYASGGNAQCCGDDTIADTWADSQNEACYEGTFYTDADNVPGSFLCELISTGEQGNCDAHNELGCWSNEKCCGDDADEAWSHSTDTNLNNILVGASCYNGKWFVRTNARVTYYEIFT